MSHNPFISTSTKLEEFTKQYLTIFTYDNKEFLMMFKLLSIIVIIFHGVQSMMNGIYADSKDFPFVVAIFNFNSYHCSGILINELNVLTAGHTVDVYSINLKLSVVIGNVGISNVLDSSDNIYLVKNVYVYPQFARYIPEGGNEEFFLHDIAVLKLHRRVHKRIPTPTPIGWASLMNVEAPWGLMANCIIISWSRTSSKDLTLMWDRVKYVSDEISHLWGTYLLPNQKGFNNFFQYNFISSDDTGSPIVCNNQVIGLVVKGGQYDEPEKPSTFLLIYNYLEFLWEIMAEGLFDIHPWKFPYVAAIWDMRTPRCGGFIVDETHIATTGSCLRKIDGTNGSVTVGYTTLDMKEKVNWLSIKDIVKHPHFSVHSTFWPIQVSPNDIAVITLTKPLVWSPTISPLIMGQSDNFAGGRVCQVLRWVSTPLHGRKILRQLTLKRSVVVIWDERQLQCLIGPHETTSFWGRTPYVMPIAELIDGGNPIICGGYPVGMVLQDSKPRNWHGPKSARFLKIRSYISFINTVTGRTSFS